jgi:hypothetical protein
LESNLDDLRPRNHLYVSAGSTNLSIMTSLDTTAIPDGFHELTAVGYEGTSVRTQTGVSRQVRVQNTPLEATLATMVGGSNTAIEATLQFTVIANTNNIERIELLTTGGSVGAATNQSSASFSLAATNLGLGLHPFYAMVTDTSENVYRTQTQWLRIMDEEAPFHLTLGDVPPALSWPALAGRNYEILATTNLAQTFQLVTSVLASNTVGFWPLSGSAAATRWFKVRSTP